MINTAEITLVDLPPLQVARFLFFGENPADDGLAAVQSWAEQNHLLDDPDRYPLFGTRTSLPIATDPQYGYAYLIAIAPSVAEQLGIDLMELPEGRYFVTRVWVPDGGPYDMIDEGWARLKAALDENHFVREDRPALERFFPAQIGLSPMPLDLYLPVVKLP
jgi:DNA gyrase inhibitor GyrI